MTAPIATKEKVFAAAEELFAKGIIVTQERIRKEIGGGSYKTISEHLREWKGQTDKDVPAKDYPMPEPIRKFYEEMNQANWNAFVNHYELIVDNEKILELEKENESLRDKLEIAKQDSIRLEQLERIREEDKQRFNNLMKDYKSVMEQHSKDMLKINELENTVDNMR